MTAMTNLTLHRLWLQSIPVLVLNLVIGAVACRGQSSLHVLAPQEGLNGRDLLIAEQKLRDTVEQARASANKSEVVQAYAALGIFYQDIGRFSEAESYLERSIHAVVESAGPETDSLVPLISHLAWLYIETGRTAEARCLNVEVWIDRLRASDSHSGYLPALLEIAGGVYALQKKFGKAEEMFHKDFDLLIIPNVAHGYGEASQYMARRRWDYFVKNLAGNVPPHEYEMKSYAATIAAMRMGPSDDDPYEVQ